MHVTALSGTQRTEIEYCWYKIMCICTLWTIKAWAIEQEEAVKVKPLGWLGFVSHDDAPVSAWCLLASAAAAAGGTPRLTSSPVHQVIADPMISIISPHWLSIKNSYPLAKSETNLLYPPAVGGTGRNKEKIDRHFILSRICWCWNNWHKLSGEAVIKCYALAFRLLGKNNEVF